MGAPALAITINDFDSASNDRFANDSSFVLDGADFSGVGISSNGRWGTMVSENVFVSANHFHPGNSDSLTFSSTNDPNGPSVSIGVKSGQRIGNTDIWVGVLESALPQNYGFYEMALSPEIGSNAFMVGRSPSTFATTKNVAVGRNRITTTATFDGSDPVEGAQGSAIVLNYDDAPTAVQFESIFETGDSGAPLFVQDAISGALTLVGTNWIVGEAPAVGNFSGTTNISANRAAIQGIIDANAVPEPSSVWLLLGAGGLLLCRRRR